MTRLEFSMRGTEPKKEPPRLRLRITPSAETILRSGHPWLFAESIRDQNRNGCLGELAVIYDRKNQFLALGLFDPDSPIRVRILHTGKPVTLDRRWWLSRLEKPLHVRQHLFDDQTTGYRLIHGESDSWPGLVLDLYDSTLVLKLYTAAWLPRLDEIASLTIGRLHPKRLVLRLSRNIQEIASNQFHKNDGDIIHGAPLTQPVLFMENGLHFEADVLRGQKTGFFLDQRENRRHVAALARGRKVLNTFSFSGGFSVYAARGGATNVTDLDISRHALDSATRNFSLNHNVSTVKTCPHELIQADAFEWLGNNAPRKFDMIVLDPPALAKRQTQRAGALNAYRTLVLSAMNHLNSGGILVACSCSAHVTAEEFFQLVRNAARSRRQCKEIMTTHQPPDHPATFKEGMYLKAIYVKT